MKDLKEVMINDVIYIPKNISSDGMEYCIVRTVNAGVFAGYVKDVQGDQITLVESRRLWKWAGAASLSELAVNGTSEPGSCKFPCVVPLMVVREWIEKIPCTAKSENSIKAVSVWTAA